MNTHLVITGCSDSLMWYRDLIGWVVPIVRDLPKEGCWLSRERSGLLNIVKHRDGVALPTGYIAADIATSLQQQDLILINGRWTLPTLDQIGTPVRGHCAIRKDQP